MRKGLLTEQRQASVTAYRWLLIFLMVICCCAMGCRWWQGDAPEPSHQLRSSFGGTPPSGLDSRARQIESNLGVR
jgi:hypothetical protein